MPTRTRTIIGTLALSGTIALSASACAGSYTSSNDQNSPVAREYQNGTYLPVGEFGVTGHGTTTRIDTPGHFPAIVQMCYKSNGEVNGIYISESSGSLQSIIINDPTCAGFNSALGSGASVGSVKDTTGGDDTHAGK